MPPSTRMPATKTYSTETLATIVEQLGDALDHVVLDALPRVERGGSGERMMLARWAHAHTTYGAIGILAREQEPDGQTVAILSRPLFEAMVDIFWIHANPVRAQELAVDNFRLLRVVIPEHYNARRQPGDPEMPIDGTDLAARDRLSKLFGQKAQRHWTTLDLRARARAVESLVPQDSDDELLDRFDEDNRLANLLIHGSPMAMNDRLKASPRGVTVQLGATAQHLANGLRHAYWSYYRMGWLLVGHLSPGSRSAIEEMHREGWPRLQTVSDGALKAAGRHGRCPCGSDRKTKDCHGAI